MCVKHKIKTITIALFAFAATASGYETDAAFHFPVDGDRFSESPVDGFEQGESGDGVTWDLSELRVSGHHNIRNIVLGDSAVLRFEGRAVYHYLLRGDTVLWQGYENAQTSMRDSVSPVEMILPLTYGSSVQTPLYWKGLYCGQSEVSMAGNLTSECDGRGRLILQGDTIDDVLRLHTVLDSRVRVSKWAKEEVPVDSLNDSLLRRVEHIYRWYSPRHRYPLARKITVAYYVQGTSMGEETLCYICTPEEQEYALGQQSGRICARQERGRSVVGQGVAGPGEKANSELSGLTVKADGATVTFTYGLSGNAAVEATVTDLHGRVYGSFSGGEQSEGRHTGTVSLVGANPGEYLLSVSVDGIRTAKLIHIK